MPERPPTITLIAAMTENRVIGAGGAMPWHLPADLSHFKKLTTGHPILMGRRTFASISKPLPNRRNLVLTRNRAFAADGVETVHSLNDAIARIELDEELFVIGGEEIYRLALPRADRIHLTLIHTKLPGDAYFPEFDLQDWLLVAESPHAADARNAYAMSFRCYERR